MIDVEKYLNNFSKGSKSISLNTIKYLINKYNNFERNMKFIHVAGTNGKGSCVEMLSNILLKQGLNVGKFISPHLIKYNERIVFNNCQITNEEISDLIEELQPIIEEYEEKEGVSVSYFELMTIMALLYFYRKKADIVVLETGLGGLQDCTNVITSPLISVITSIGLDHMHILGNTLTEIAYQKAGIIKENSNTVCFNQTEEVNNIFINEAKRKCNKIHIVKEEDIKNYNYDEDFQYFDYCDYKNIAINLKGKMQIQNAAICVECVKILNKLGYKISEESMKSGLKTVIHKARMEKISEKPLIIYDGAHNEPAIINLKSMINQYYKGFSKTFIVSILKRKDYKRMIQELMKDSNDEFIFTSGNDDAKFASKEELYNTAQKYLKNQKLQKMDLDEAIQYIKNKSSDRNINLIVGSFYIYKDALNLIK